MPGVHASACYEYDSGKDHFGACFFVASSSLRCACEDAPTSIRRNRQVEVLNLFNTPNFHLKLCSCLFAGSQSCCVAPVCMHHHFGTSKAHWWPWHSGLEAMKQVAGARYTMAAWLIAQHFTESLCFLRPAAAAHSPRQAAWDGGRAPAHARRILKTAVLLCTACNAPAWRRLCVHRPR